MTVALQVLDKGFAWRGETYPSLSAIARAITQRVRNDLHGRRPKEHRRSVQ
jgi:hypothetical protein